jgi:Cys-tRNA(Pro)/Cys-tRNA(Cys) deacylase
MKKDFPTFIDETAVLFDTICLSGGKIGLTLDLNAEKLATAIGAKFADLTL